jgi:hypothetical protein
MTAWAVRAGVAVFLAWPLVASAEEIQARGALRLDTRYETEQQATVLDGRVEFAVELRSLTFGGTYRAYDFGDGRYNPRGIDPVYHFKHRYIEGRLENLLFRGGHFFSTFGRGLVLRSFEDVDLEHDTALDGFLAEYQTGTLGLAALAGQVTERLSSVQSLRHRVRGGRLSASLGPRVALAVSGLARNSQTLDEDGSPTGRPLRFGDYVLGADGEVWLGAFTMAGEYAYRNGDYYRQPEEGDVRGRGTYLSGTLNTKGVTLLAEYKDYYRFEHFLVNPPTCVKDHVWILMNRVTHDVDLDNERGFLVESTLMAGDHLNLTGGASEARTRAGGLSHWEIFGQVDQVRAVRDRRGGPGVRGGWS